MALYIGCLHVGRIVGIMMWEDLGIRKQHAAAETPKAEYEAPRNCVGDTEKKKKKKSESSCSRYLVPCGVQPTVCLVVYLPKRVA